MPLGAPVAVIGHGWWRRRFGGDGAVVGRTIAVNGTPVDSRGAIDRTLFDAQIGSVLRLGVIREGKPLELRVPIVSESTRRPQGVA